MSLKETLDNRVRRYHEKVNKPRSEQVNDVCKKYAFLIWNYFKLCFLLLQKEDRQVIIYVGTSKVFSNSVLSNRVTYKTLYMGKYITIPVDIPWPAKVFEYLKEFAIKDGLEIVPATFEDYSNGEVLCLKYKIVYNPPSFKNND